MNPIISLERPHEKFLNESKYITIKCHNTPGDSNARSCEFNLPYYRGGSSEEKLVWKDRLLKVLDGQSISTAAQRYMFIKRIYLVIGDIKETVKHADLNISIDVVEIFNKVLNERQDD